MSKALVLAAAIVALATPTLAQQGQVRGTLSTQAETQSAAPGVITPSTAAAIAAGVLFLGFALAGAGSDGSGGSGTGTPGSTGTTGTQ